MGWVLALRLVSHPTDQRVGGWAMPNRWTDPLPPAPNPSRSTTPAPRWLLPVLVAAGAVLVGWALLFARAEDAERDRRVDDLTTGFTDGTCDP